MADDKPTLHIDTDWKKQAQEEKRKLAEQSAVAKPAVAAPAPSAQASAAASPARRAGQLPQASFPGLVQTLMTQALYYLGDLAARTGEAMNLDMAKMQIDMLAMLEEKTKNNLTGDESRLLDTALYETRMRFVSVASQLL